jgi:hypothetical protein
MRERICGNILGVGDTLGHCNGHVSGWIRVCGGLMDASGRGTVSERRQARVCMQCGSRL